MPTCATSNAQLESERMPIRNITPSSYVGPQVRKWRERKGWSQQDLADRLRELGAEHTGWSQTKVHKLEAGKLTRVLVDDVFELALALDVSPLYLLTPLEGHDEQENAFKVWLGGKVDRWPREVRQWIRGVRPILTSVITEATRKHGAVSASTCSSLSRSLDGL